MGKTGDIKGVREIPADIRYTDGNPSMWTAVAIRPNTDTIWMETGTNRTSR